MWLVLKRRHINFALPLSRANKAFGPAQRISTIRNVEIECITVDFVEILNTNKLRKAIYSSMRVQLICSVFVTQFIDTIPTY